MRKLNRPIYDDNAALDALATNKRVGSYPGLQGHLLALKAGYAQYVASNGNVAMIAGVPLPPAMGSHLRNHYATPPNALNHITVMREQTDFMTCSMCGSLHSGTLDHVMDKDDHPAFAIFAPNLVPACKCNSKRLKPLTGPNPGERILHPYFDDILTERIVAARFTDLGLIPRVETRILLNQADPHFAAADFHHDSVIMRTSIHGYLRSRWTKLVRRPGVIISDLRANPASWAELKAIVEDERDRTDEARDSKNNWDSVFLTGLLDPDVINWLHDRFQAIGRVSNGPLA